MSRSEENGLQDQANASHKKSPTTEPGSSTGIASGLHPGGTLPGGGPGATVGSIGTGGGASQPSGSGPGGGK